MSGSHALRGKWLIKFSERVAIDLRHQNAELMHTIQPSRCRLYKYLSSIIHCAAQTHDNTACCRDMGKTPSTMGHKVTTQRLGGLLGKMGPNNALSSSWSARSKNLEDTDGYITVVLVLLFILFSHVFYRHVC
ncbi:unnamed protein product [Litomosoides sigmodontis]|uniref:Domain of unknown function DB domain-containing protein n=1 Tax=Litomosoides sigmodontis TaxID=42156 RepID=A0A3P6TXB1_LITSI|nr:unnamed protein product [Litomosoides sigmodontis]